MLSTHLFQRVSIEPGYLFVPNSTTKVPLEGGGFKPKFSIKTPDGLPSVNIFWLGDSHVKEIIVDQEIHLCGSHNWLSYRGDYLPRGESVYKVTIPNQVQEAYEFLSHRFQDHAQKLWQKALEVRDPQMAVNSLCVWASLGMEDLALKEIQGNHCLELLPVWEKIKAQGKTSVSR